MSRYEAETLEIVTREASPYDWIRWNEADVENNTVYVVMRGGDQDTVWATREDALDAMFPENAHGGYKMEYIVNECIVLCAKCAREEYEDRVSEGQTVTDHDIYGESTDGFDDSNGLYCECGAVIVEPYCSGCFTDICDLPENTRLFRGDNSDRQYCADCIMGMRETAREYDAETLFSEMKWAEVAEYMSRGVYALYELNPYREQNRPGSGTHSRGLFYDHNDQRAIDYMTYYYREVR